MSALHQRLLVAAMDFLHGGSICIYDRAGSLLAELPFEDIHPIPGDHIQIRCQVASIVQSGEPSRASMKVAGGAEVEDLTVGPEGQVRFDSQTFVQGDRVSLILVGV